jgi:hypothetical protein
VCGICVYVNPAHGQVAFPVLGCFVLLKYGHSYRVGGGEGRIGEQGPETKPNTALTRAVKHNKTKHPMG